MCGNMCGCCGPMMGDKLSKEQKLALLERQEKGLQADLEMIKKMRETVSAGKDKA